MSCWRRHKSVAATDWRAVANTNDPYIMHHVSGSDELCVISVEVFLGLQYAERVDCVEQRSVGTK